MIASLAERDKFVVTELRIENFKSLADVSLQMGQLTLLTGLNGSGKSSVMQALLLLRQSYGHGMLPNVGLSLNGEMVEIGQGRDALFEGADIDEIEFRLGTSDGEAHIWRFTYDSASDVLTLMSPSVNVDAVACGLFGDDFHYLCAERIGPRTFYPTADYEVRQHGQIGKGGEYSAQFLAENETMRVASPILHHHSSNSQYLRDQAEAWIGEVSPGTRLHYRRLAGTDLFNMTYSSAIGRVVGSEHRPTNVGFGVSYVLSVIVVALSTERGGMILVENPEAHLHPRGQVQIGQLLASAAAAGVQVVIETHSDHVLNGVRLAVHSGRISAGSVQIHHFSVVDGPDAARTSVTTPVIDNDGRIDPWPEGFFDQYDIALMQLLAPRQ